METNEVKNEAGFDKKAWLEQKQADRKEAFDLIDVTADSMGNDPELFRLCLDVMARFDRYSVSNILLLAAQNPNATRLADFAYWKKEGVSVKKGEKSLLLLEPGKEYTNLSILGRVLLTRGEHGCVQFLWEQASYCPAPKIDCINAVGSGDCFTAAWLHAQIRGFTDDGALLIASAAGAANAVQFPAAMITREDIEKITGFKWM